MNSSKKGNAVPRLKKGEMATAIMAFFQTDPVRSFNYKQISSAIGAKTNPMKEAVIDLLNNMLTDGSIIETSPGKYKLNKRSSTAEGVFERKKNGKNKVVTLDGDEYFIAERNSMRAMHGDKVRILIYAKRLNKEPEGEVIDILEKSEQPFVGTLEIQKNYAFLLTDNKNLANDIFIPKEELNGAKNGEKVVVKITDWPERARNPIGKVVDVLGKTGDNNTEMHAILAEFGLPYRYPKEVEDAADHISDQITDKEREGREDMRGVPTFTIDPKDAKDFDDALSIRQLENGNWEIGVHIADVTHYVQPDSIIDKEAKTRATSIYLVDRTIPMLPEKLCNQICSLRPNEEKLCYSAIFEMDDQAQIINHRIGRTVIFSNRRFTYEEAQAIIEGEEGDFKPEILTLNRLAQQLRKNRFTAGAINFDRWEVRFDIDQKGHPIGVYFKISKEANKLIEEFMLLANRTVAESVGKVPKNKTAKPFVYRIHDLPNPEKLSNFSEFIQRFGYKLKTVGSKTEVSKAINALLDQAQGKPEENLIETVAIRAMAKAIYSTVNVGHYGLAFDYYTHFTSPIRRYPDMMVHRLLTDYMEKKKGPNADELEEECKHSSEMEQIAANAERASIKYKQVEFMADHLGGVFEGVISGVTEWGLYVEINENKCEGMIPMRDLGDDYYEFDEKNYALVGKRTHKIYRLGDTITIQVARANLERKQLDFVLYEEEGKENPHLIRSLSTPSTNNRRKNEKSKRVGDISNFSSKGKKKGKGKRRR